MPPQCETYPFPAASIASAEIILGHFHDSERKRYEALAGATGGSFLAVEDLLVQCSWLGDCM